MLAMYMSYERQQQYSSAVPIKHDFQKNEQNSDVAHKRSSILKKRVLLSDIAILYFTQLKLPFSLNGNQTNHCVTSNHFHSINRSCIYVQA
jgi:hypothetical protein